jgi:hypothetical protein
VLSDDIFSIDPLKIADVKVIATIFDGRIIVSENPNFFYKTLPSGLILRP